LEKLYLNKSGLNCFDEFIKFYNLNTNNYVTNLTDPVAKSRGTRFSLNKIFDIESKVCFMSRLTYNIGKKH